MEGIAPRTVTPFLVATWLCLTAAPSRPAGEGANERGARIEFQRDDHQGRMQVLIDGREAFGYCYGGAVDLPHYFPVRSPSGKLLTIEQTEPYPHHRSVWFADTVRLEGRRRASFYNALYTRVTRDDPTSPFRDRIRHVEFLPATAEGGQAKIGMRLLWEMDLNVPVLDELRRMQIVALGQGEYFVDIMFTLTASYGDVAFESDAVHYAWPFVRMSPEFSVSQGGTITDSEGRTNQAQTNGQIARWVDDSNTVEGVTEGLAVFSHSDNDHPHRWLTRDYGTFGPRRSDDKSGKPFTLKRGESLVQRVGLLVHRGDVKGGRVAERYEQYIDGKL